MTNAYYKEWIIKCYLRWTTTNADCGARVSSLPRVRMLPSVEKPRLMLTLTKVTNNYSFVVLFIAFRRA